jgi:hypothetical protein
MCCFIISIRVCLPPRPSSPEQASSAVRSGGGVGTGWARPRQCPARDRSHRPPSLDLPRKHQHHILRRSTWMGSSPCRRWRPSPHRPAFATAGRPVEPVLLQGRGFPRRRCARGGGLPLTAVVRREGSRRGPAREPGQGRQAAVRSFFFS